MSHHPFGLLSGILLHTAVSTKRVAEAPPSQMRLDGADRPGNGTSSPLAINRRQDPQTRNHRFPLLPGGQCVGHLSKNDTVQCRDELAETVDYSEFDRVDRRLEFSSHELDLQPMRTMPCPTSHGPEINHQSDRLAQRPRPERLNTHCIHGS